MKRLLLSLALLGLVYTGPSQAVASESDRAACEGYCASIAAGCYILVGIFIGRDKCDTMYEGCTDGCVAALMDEE